MFATLSMKVLTCPGSGTKFLKRWMDFLEENADLRYANVADLMSSD